MYTKTKFPDGQISCTVDSFTNPFIIKERINSYEDLIFVKSISDAYTVAHGKVQELFIPCMFGQRSDRRFKPNQSFDLKIICDIINSCNFPKVKILDSHSDVCLALINNSEKISSFEYVQKTVENINFISNLEQPIILVSPDAGAYKKVFEYGEKLELEVVAAVKHRDLEGKVDLTFMGDVAGKECLIVDDLCDGGYTFLKLGEKLKEQGAIKVYLYVSHGYFSKGFEELNKVIDHTYCTNSVKDIGDFEHNGQKLIKTNVTQWKVV